MDVRAGLGRLRGELCLVDITETTAVLDLPRLCAFARERGILCVVDNTFCTPLLQRPLALGADVVIHSATKAIGGHSDLLLGAAVTADEGRSAQMHEIRTVTGATPGALEVFLCLRGLRTLPLRLERAQHNATILAQRLSDHSLELLVHTTSLGGVETTIERRAKYPAERHIPADLLRVSVGCEHVEDLWSDLQQALDGNPHLDAKMPI